MTKVRCEYTELVELHKLQPNPKNANKHPEDQIKRLAQIIDYQGMRSPIVVSKRSGFITKGHGRLEALKELGWKEAPVDYQEYENDAQEYADIIADNEIARWANTDLAMVNTEMLDLGPDLDIDMLGIKDFVIEPIEKYDEETQDDVPEVTHDPITKRGDVWLLGEHRVMCGDSTMIDDVEKLMNGEKADMVFTDPPYNVAFNGRSGKFGVIKNDNIAKDKFEELIIEVCSVIKTLNPESYYIWCNWKFYGILQENLDYKSCIVWAKNVFGMGNNYRHQHEFCLFNGSIDDHIKNETDLWEIKKDSRYIHPTQKPVELSVRAFSNHIKQINIVDLFGGSGSTLIGAQQTGRKAFLMELDEHYCDVIIERWEKFTGKKAKLESTGKLYSEMKNV